MSDSAESYMNFYTYEYLIISKLNFERIADELVNASLMWEDEREKIGSINGSKKQNITLVKYFQEEKRGFESFLNILRSDSSCVQHAELARTILARNNSKSEDLIDDDEVLQVTRKDSSSDTDSSAFTYETQRYSDINSPVWSGRREESEFEGSCVERRSATPRSILHPLQSKQDCRDRKIQRKNGLVSMLIFLFLIAFAILNMPLRFGYKCSKMILTTW